MQPKSAVADDAAVACGSFDAAKLRNSGWLSAFADCVLSYPHRLIRFFRFLTPVLRCPHRLRWLSRVPGLSWLQWVVVLRYDEVREVLSNSRTFPVDWGHRMIEVTEGKNFVLGMPENAEYRLSYEQLAEAFPRCEVAQHIARKSATLAAGILDGKTSGARGELDAVADLVTAVPAALCESYYGITIGDKVQFANWTLAISAYVFGPSTDATGTALARAAATCLRKAIRDSIATAENNPGQGIVLPHFIRMKRKDARIDDQVILGQLFGMVLGFIPTNVLAGGNILETLLRRPAFLERARAAAVAGDDDLLWRCLREALRFRHINPGPWRTCPNGHVFGAGGPDPIRIAADSRVLAATQSAMFDPRRIERPDVFDPERRDEDFMVFGAGQHWCIGAYIAMAQITQTFKPLLKMSKLEAVGNRKVRTERFNGLFPLHLKVRFVV